MYTTGCASDRRGRRFALVLPRRPAEAEAPISWLPRRPSGTLVEPPAWALGGTYALAAMEILTGRVLLRPTDLGRSLRFYEQAIGLAIYREWGTGPARGVVFFLGGGLLEISGTSPEPPSPAIGLVLQVRNIRATHLRLIEQGVVVDAEPEQKPWGLV